MALNVCYTLSLQWPISLSTHVLQFHSFVHIGHLVLCVHMYTRTLHYSITFYLACVHACSTSGSQRPAFGSLFSCGFLCLNSGCAAPLQSSFKYAVSPNPLIHCYSSSRLPGLQLRWPRLCHGPDADFHVLGCMLKDS